MCETVFAATFSTLFLQQFMFNVVSAALLILASSLNTKCIEHVTLHVLV
jgi:hypothetical protein